MEFIITTEERLSQIIETAVRNIVGARPDSPNQVKDNLSIDEAVTELSNIGCKISKSYLYVLVHKNEVPFDKFGSKLVFNRYKIIAWARKRNQKLNESAGALAIAQSARNKQSVKK